MRAVLGQDEEHEHAPLIADPVEDIAHRAFLGIVGSRPGTPARRRIDGRGRGERHGSYTRVT